MIINKLHKYDSSFNKSKQKNHPKHILITVHAYTLVPFARHLSSMGPSRIIRFGKSWCREEKPRARWRRRGASWLSAAAGKGSDSQRAGARAVEKRSCLGVFFLRVCGRLKDLGCIWLDGKVEGWEERVKSEKKISSKYTWLERKVKWKNRRDVYFLS